MELVKYCPFFPEHGAPLPSQLIPGLSIIIDDGLIETALQFFQGHATCLRRLFGVMHPIAGVRQASGVSLGHPAKEGFDGPLSFGAIRGRLFSDDAKPIHQDLPRPFRRKNLASVMEDNCGLSKTRPGMLASCEADQVIFPLQALLDQAHVVLLASAGRERGQHRESLPF